MSFLFFFFPTTEESNGGENAYFLSRIALFKVERQTLQPAKQLVASLCEKAIKLCSHIRDATFSMNDS